MPSKMNRFKSLTTTTFVVGALLIGALAVAQDGQGRRNNRFGGGGGGNNTSFLLRRKDVQADLQLTSEQKTKLDALMESMRGNRGDRGGRRGGNNAGGGGTPPTDAERQARRAEMESQRAKMQKDINEILTSSQTSRLKEISIQLRGNMALMDNDIQKELGFTSEQKTKIQSLRDKMGEASQSIFQKMQDGSLSRDDAMKSMQKNNDVMKDELAKVLSRSQADKLKAMGGASFKADPSESQFGGFGGRRGGGRRGGGGGGGL